jgi:hypothetical protein
LVQRKETEKKGHTHEDKNKEEGRIEEEETRVEIFSSVSFQRRFVERYGRMAQ